MDQPDPATLLINHYQQTHNLIKDGQSLKPQNDYKRLGIHYNPNGTLTAWTIVTQNGKPHMLQMTHHHIQDPQLIDKLDKQIEEWIQYKSS